MSEDVRALRINHESAIAMAERTIRRLFILILTLVVLWGMTIGGFLWYLNQYDFESYKYQQDGSGLNFVGGDWNGVSIHGTDNPNTQTEEEER